MKLVIKEISHIVSGDVWSLLRPMVSFDIRIGVDAYVYFYIPMVRDLVCDYMIVGT